MPHVEESSNDLTVSLTVRLGFNPSNRAAAPETNGHDCEVPLNSVDAVSEPWAADRTSLPGANKSTQRPVLDEVNLASSRSVDPTVRMDAAEAGEKSHAFLLSLPAAPLRGATAHVHVLVRVAVAF